jgi:hypothetical protein
MKYGDLVGDVARRAHFETTQAPARAVDATLLALLEVLPPRGSRLLLDDLRGAPPALSAALAGERAPGSCTEFYACGARRLGVPEARAVEEMQLVCAELARLVDPEVRGALVRALPDQLATLFQPIEPHEAPPVGAGTGHTLAQGKPGSSHPLSEARAGSTHPVGTAQPRARQPNSVAEPNPHGDSKVSSARGLTQEREHESLAEGRSKRP